MISHSVNSRDVNPKEVNWHARKSCFCQSHVHFPNQALGCWLLTLFME